MRYRICKMIEVESGHLLTKHPDKCRFPHGHTRKVELVFSAETLDDREMVFDFKLVKLLIGDFVDSFDHALCMNTSDPKFEDFKATYGERIIGFDNEDPTTEVMARVIYQTMAQAMVNHLKAPTGEYPLRDCVRLDTVRIWETTSSWAEYGV